MFSFILGLIYGKHYPYLRQQYYVLKAQYEEYKHENSYVFPLIEECVFRDFRDKEAASTEIEKLHHTYYDVVSVIVLNNIAANILTTGRYHFHRGMLNPIGGDALSLFYELVNKLEKSGFYSKEKADEDRKWISDSIKEMG